MRAFVVAAFGVVIGLQGFVTAESAQAPAARAIQARVRFDVTVPQDDAELLVEGSATQGTGRSRVVESGPLEAGRRYEYTFTAKWRPIGYTLMTRNKTVSFTAGDTVTVDLATDEGTDRAEVVYAPTANNVVSEMVKLADITPDDVVYEPGCGDARITIAAVRAGARKGVGIDLDAALVAESRRKVKAAGLDDRIDIRLGDALDIKDLSDATVVFLYMGNQFNMLIRPILWAQLRVGARVVSNAFTMGDWRPDATVGSDETGYTLHLWTITQEVRARAEKP
jgi:uncharacterized protein (TIGR03000 family)